jgi:hypothetical protein
MTYPRCVAGAKWDSISSICSSDDLASQGSERKTFSESEMVLSSECMRKVLDTADIAREVWFQ